MNILDTDINTLKKDQMKALEEHFLLVLDDIKSLFKEHRFQDIENKYVLFSPAGDCMGSDDYFINFSWNSKEKDIMDILHMAKELTKDEVVEKDEEDYL